MKSPSSEHPFASWWESFECGSYPFAIEGVADNLTSWGCECDSLKCACRECVQAYGRFVYQKALESVRDAMLSWACDHDNSFDGAIEWVRDDIINRKIAMIQKGPQ